jgi:hypothetical protein
MWRGRWSKRCFRDQRVSRRGAATWDLRASELRRRRIGPTTRQAKNILAPLPHGGAPSRGSRHLKLPEASHTLGLAKPGSFPTAAKPGCSERNVGECAPRLDSPSQPSRGGDPLHAELETHIAAQRIRTVDGGRESADLVLAARSVANTRLKAYPFALLRMSSVNPNQKPTVVAAILEESPWSSWVWA